MPTITASQYLRGSRNLDQLRGEIEKVVSEVLEIIKPRALGKIKPFQARSLGKWEISNMSGHNQSELLLKGFLHSKAFPTITKFSGSKKTELEPEHILIVHRSLDDFIESMVKEFPAQLEKHLEPIFIAATAFSPSDI